MRPSALSPSVFPTPSRIPPQTPRPTPTRSDDYDMMTTVVTATSAGAVVLLFASLGCVCMMHQAVKKRKLHLGKAAATSASSFSDPEGGMSRYASSASPLELPLVRAAGLRYGDAVRNVIAHYGAGAAMLLDMSGYGIVHYIAMLGDGDALRVLLAGVQGVPNADRALLSMRDVRGDTPLMVAVARRHVTFARQCIVAGADVAAANTKTGETALHIACRPSDAEPTDGDHAAAALAELLGTLGALESRDGHGRTALHTASASGSVGSLLLLLRMGAKVNARDGSGATPLLVAVRMAQRGSVAALLGAVGVDLVACDTRGMTALHWAVALGDAGATQQLLSALRGGGVDIGDVVTRRHVADGPSVLALAIREGHLHLAQMVFGAASVVIPEETAKDLLALARQHGHTGDLLSLLQAHTTTAGAQRQSSSNANVRLSPVSPGDACDDALITQSPFDDESSYGVVVSHLLHTPPSQSSPSSASSTASSASPPHADDSPSHLPALASSFSSSLDERSVVAAALASPPSDYANVLEAMLAAGPTSDLLQMLDRSGLGVLHHAARAGDASALAVALRALERTQTPPQFARAMTSSPSSLNMAGRDATGNGALHWAAQSGAAGCCALLLLAGAQPDTRNTSGETPLHLACRVGAVEVARLLLDRLGSVRDQVNACDAAKRTPLHDACGGNGDARVVRLLLLSGADCEVVDEHGASPLLVSIRAGREEAALALLDKGANAERRDAGGNTPLHWAAATGAVRVVDKMLKMRGRRTVMRNDVNARQETALFLAAREGHAEIVALLLAHKVDPSMPDFRGRKPLDVAPSEQVRRLLSSALGGADGLSAPDVE